MNFIKTYDKTTDYILSQLKVYSPRYSLLVNALKKVGNFSSTTTLFLSTDEEKDSTAYIVDNDSKKYLLNLFNSENYSIDNYTFRKLDGENFIDYNFLDKKDITIKKHGYVGKDYELSIMNEDKKYLSTVVNYYIKNTLYKICFKPNNDFDYNSFMNSLKAHKDNISFKYILDYFKNSLCNMEYLSVEVKNDNELIGKMVFSNNTLKHYECIENINDTTKKHEHLENGILVIDYIKSDKENIKNIDDNYRKYVKKDIKIFYPLM